MNQVKTRVIPHARASIGDEEAAAVVHTLKSGWLTTGPVVSEFEAAFSKYLGGGVRSVATNSNTMGLMIALKALGIGPGDEVIVPTNTFVATAMSAYHLGATVVPVDIDPVSLCISPERVEQAVTDRTRMVLPVHLGGLSCDMDAIHDIAARHRLLVVEDAAHALSASWKGVPIGAGRSAATVFSFYATKSITCGEGGMVTTADPDLAGRLCRLRHHGIDRDAFNRLGRQSWEYDVAEDGFKANMTDLAAAIGLVQLTKLDDLHRRRDAIARRYLKAFADLPVTLPAGPAEGDRHSWHLFIIRLQKTAPIDRDAFLNAMQARGIQCGVHYVPLHRHSFWQGRLAFSIDDFPVAESVFSSTVTIPLYAAMSDDDVDYVINVVRGLLS